jgi:hypothetical protein
MAKPILIEARYRSKLEERIADQLEKEGIEFDYETLDVPYTVPARHAKYKPDFIPKANPRILIEGKGRFGGHQDDKRGAEERQKLILVKEQNPDLDIRIVFQDAGKKIYKGSKTTYAKWAEDHGFLFSDKGVVPPEWIAELKQLQGKRK